MELFRTQKYYILLNKDSTLWIDRNTGQLDAKPAWELANGQDIECLGVFYGLVGRVKFNKVDRFILIRDSVLVGTVPLGNEVYKIKSIVLLNPNTELPDDLGLRICAKHNYEDFLTLSVTPETASTGNSAFARAWGNVKSATLSQLKTTNFQSNTQTKGPSLNYKENLNLSKNERRLEEEIFRIFTDSDSFYYCPDNKGDITNSVPRQGKELDDRFFWNKHMLSDIMEIGNQHSQAWVCPIIQGYVEIAPIYKQELSLILISRRSRFRAGTRYKRRGLNPDGHCANYVETEQIISYKSHAVSFVQVRGSVPLYWSQPGIKYRPAPIIHKNFAENQTACEKHFEEQLKLYSKVIIVNLVEQLGKESIIFNAYTQHVLSLNSPDLVYVCFDFHEYCRGMHFERVSLLTDKLKEESIFHDMGYSWKDKQGLICEQKAIFRINCIDCLDRTNVVQTALARAVLIRQLKKLGIVSPEGDLPRDMNRKLQVMWANNGDIISKQYAGTAALKGDFTRTGDRKLSGLMKDGMTSANRYYLSRFKDNLRQACLDIMCGEMENPEESISDDDDEEDEEEDNNENSEEEEKTSLQHIKTLIEDCKRLMLTDQEHVINAWPLIAAEDPTAGLCGEDFDRILILTKDMLKIAEYNVHLDSMKLIVCVPLRYIQEITLGPLLKSTTSTPVAPSRSTSSSTKSKRLYTKLVLSGTSTGEQRHLILTSSRIHYFNNQAAIVRSIDEKNEALRAVVESVSICMRLCGCPLDVQYGPIDVSKAQQRSGNLVVSNVMSLINKHRKQSDGSVMLPQPIQMEIGTEAVESYIPSIGIIRSNVSIDAADLDLNDILIDDTVIYLEAVESYIPSIGIIRSNVSIDAADLDLNDILIDDNVIYLDEHSKPHDLSLSARLSPDLTAELEPETPPSIVDGSLQSDPNGLEGSTCSVPNYSVPNSKNSIINSKDAVPNSKEPLEDIDNDVRLRDKSPSESYRSLDSGKSSLQDGNNCARGEETKETESTPLELESLSTSENADAKQTSNTHSDLAQSENTKATCKPSVIVKLNSCDLDNADVAGRQKSLLTLSLKTSGQNKSNENLSTRDVDAPSGKIVKSSSEKDLKSADLAKSQSDNSTLRQNFKTAMVSPTNALSKLVTKGVANLNSLDPRRRLSVQRLASPGGEEGKLKEKLEEKWKRHACKTKLIVL